MGSVMRSRLAVFITLLLMPLPVLFTPATTAAVATEPDTATGFVSRDVGLRGFRDIVVAESAGRMFINEGTSGRIRVTDLDGRPVTWLNDLPGALDLSLSDDGSRLYVALWAVDAVAVVSTTTLQVRLLRTGPSSCPREVAATAGKLWFYSSCNGQGGPIRALDPVSGAVSGPLTEDYWGALLVTSPVRPGELFVAERGISPTTLWAYDATGGATPSLSLRVKRRDTGSNLSDLIVTPDGSTLVQASGAPYVHRSFSADDLTDRTTYPTAEYPNGAAVRADGLLALSSDHDSPDIWFFHQGSTDIVDTVSLPSAPVARHGLVFAGENLVVLTGGPYGGRYLLSVLHLPSAGRQVTSIEGSVRPPQPGVGERVHAQLYGAPTNAVLQIHLVVAGQRTLVGQGPSPLDVEHVIPAGATIEISYAGDPTRAPSYLSFPAPTAPPSSTADAGKDIGIRGFSDLVVDPGHGRLFVSHSAGVVVTDLAGTVTHRLDALPGAQDMVLSADGARLWVPLFGDAAVAAVDTSTLAITRYPIGAATCPSSVAEVGGLIWVLEHCAERGATTRVLDPATGQVTTVSPAYSERLASSPSLPGVLVRHSNDGSPGDVHLYNTLSSPPRLSLRAQRTGLEWHSRDGVVTADGRRLLLTGMTQSVTALSVDDASVATSYLTTGLAYALAERDDGVVAAGISTAREEGSLPRVELFDPGRVLPQASFDLPNRATGLAFGPGNRLYAVSGSWESADQYRLHVLTVPARRDPELAISSDSQQYAPGEVAHLTARLLSGAPWTDLAVYAVTPGCRRLVTRGTVANTDPMELDVRVQEPTTFEVVQEPNVFFRAATASTTVSVPGEPPPGDGCPEELLDPEPSVLTLTIDRTSYAHGEVGAVAVALTTSAARRTVTLYASTAGQRRVLRAGTVPLGDVLRATLGLTERTVVEAVFDGDTTHAPSTVTQTLTVRAGISAEVVGARRTTTKFSVFRAGDRYKAMGAVAPAHPGQCVRWRIERKVKGSYRPMRLTGCKQLSAASLSTLSRPSTPAFRGRRYRIRLEWAGDGRNDAAVSTWRYLRFR